MFELASTLKDGARELNEMETNSISLNAGCELFIAFVTLSTHEADVSLFARFFNLFFFVNSRVESFSDLKTELVKQGQKYVSEAVRYSDKIAELANGFVKDGSVVCTFFYSMLIAQLRQILTHSHSRVVMKALIHAHKRKRISVYVTEARPRGLGCAFPTVVSALVD
jgi:translation initiation factor eIF-2B subunit alpha